jgi:hypothetical protein
MLKSKLAVENNSAQVARVFKTQLARRSWVDHHLSQQLPVKWQTHLETTCGPALMI